MRNLHSRAPRPAVLISAARPSTQWGGAGHTPVAGDPITLAQVIIEVEKTVTAKPKSVATETATARAGGKAVSAIGMPAGRVVAVKITTNRSMPSPRDPRYRRRGLILWKSTELRSGFVVMQSRKFPRRLNH